MSKSILVIDTQDLKDMIEVLRMNEMYCEANVLEQCPLQDTTELLEALEELSKNMRFESDIDAYNKLYKALGGLNND